MHGDLCTHLGIDSSIDLDDRYSNLCHVHAEYLKMIQFYSSSAHNASFSSLEVVNNINF